MQTLLTMSGAALIVVWGVGHLMPTRAIVAGFGDISRDNRRIITMEWVLEGLTLCFLGILVALVKGLVGADQAATILVVRACAAMLVVMAAVSTVTGARTSPLPMKLCPVLKTVAAGLMVAGTI